MPKLVLWRNKHNYQLILAKYPPQATDGVYSPECDISFFENHNFCLDLKFINLIGFVKMLVYSEGHTTAI